MGIHPQPKPYRQPHGCKRPLPDGRDDDHRRYSACQLLRLGHERQIPHHRAAPASAYGDDARAPRIQPRPQRLTPLSGEHPPSLLHKYSGGVPERDGGRAPSTNSRRLGQRGQSPLNDDSSPQAAGIADAAICTRYVRAVYGMCRGLDAAFTAPNPPRAARPKALLPDSR